MGLDRIFIWILLLATLTGGRQVQECIVSKCPAEFVGRFLRVTDEEMSFGWSGSAIRMGFVGTFFTVTLSDQGSNSLQIEVDGKVARLDLRPGRATYTIAAGLERGIHKVEIYRRTEGSFGPTVFHGAGTDGTFVPTGRRLRRLLVIGGSASTGYGIEGNNQTCPFTASTQNWASTYAALAGRMFNADVTTIAWSGYGVRRGYSGDEERQLSRVWTRVIPTESTSVSPFTVSYDAVIFNLGANDFMQGSPPSSFEEAYLEDLAQLRRWFPAARIYAAVGPLREPLIDEMSRRVISVLDSFRAKGETKIGLLRFVGPGDGEWGCDWHPNAKAHRRFADVLAGALRSDLGWTSQE